MVEKLVVEFEVRREEQKDYGYVEKYLKYAGEAIPYKAIVREGELLAIVTERYRLLENEKVEEVVKKIAEDRVLTLNIVKGRTRLHAFLMDEEKGVGVVIHNSVDGSMAFRIDAIMKVGSAWAIFKCKTLEMVYRRHTKNIDKLFAEVDNIVSEVLKETDKYKEFLSKLEEYKAKDMIDGLVELAKQLPKKYIEIELARVKMGFDRETATLRDIYESIARRIWTARIDVKTKIDRFEILNKNMAAMVGLAELLGYS